ncbi:MAG TPA: response regulator [Nitrospira sp.]|nr:response regulator [Nitrospira sp.]
MSLSRQQRIHFLLGGGEMGRRMRDFPWSQSSLGPVDRWPQSLRSAISILLPSRAQIALFWGPDLITFYNDAYRPVLGTKHPRALGRPVREVWSELWDVGLRELFEGVLTTGEALWASDYPFFMQRYGFLEETFFDISYDPIRDETGAVGGLFCIVSDTTRRVVSERRLRTLRDLSMSTSMERRSVQDACRAAAQILSENTQDVPFALIYSLEPNGKQVRLVASSGFKEGTDLPIPVTVRLDVSDAEQGSWPFTTVMRSNQPQEVPGLVERFSTLSCGAWPEPVHTALVLPLGTAGLEMAGGFLAAGVSPRRPLDDDYRGFFGLLANHIATGLANARAHEEERRRAEALAELDRAKTAFLTNISHEFRTPLTLMIGPLQDALAAAASSSDTRPAVELAHRNSLRLLKLVNTLLDFSRMEAGRMQASYQPTDLAALTADLASVFRSMIERAGMRLIVNCHPLSEPVYVDRDMWEKILLNLLSNAFKFTLEGEIEVSLRKMGSEVELAVRDTGTGIPADAIPRLFERFYRVKGARGRSYEGSGIGLALVDELVKLHGGRVGVESSPGMGSTFFITIPLGRAHLPADRIDGSSTLPSTGLRSDAFLQEALRWLPDGQEPSPGHPGGAMPGPLLDEQHSTHTAPHVEAPFRNGRILVADDNADMREYLKKLLAGYDVEAVPDGRAARRAAQDATPDLILADVMMPGIDVFELLRQLRADQRTREVPVILLSARAGEESRVEGLIAGADDYLVKPFGARELLARVQAHLELSRLRRETANALREQEAALRASEAMLRLRAQQQQELVALGLAALEETDIQLIFNHAVDAVARTLQVELCTVLEVLPERRHLLLRSGVGWRPGLIGKALVPATDHSQAGYTLRTNHPVIVSDLRTETRFKAPALLREHGVVSGMSCIIWGSGHSPWGVLGAHSITPRHFTEDDVAFLQGVANVLAASVQRRYVEDGLRETEARFRTMADISPVMIWVTDATGEIEFMNETGRIYLGVTEDDVRGGRWMRLVHPQDVDAFVAEFAKCVRQRTPFYAKCRLRRADGEWRWIAAYGAPRFSPGGDFLGHVGSSPDIQDLVATQEALQESETRLRAFATDLESLVQDRTRNLVQSEQRLRALATELNLTEQRERKRLATELHDHLQQLLVLCKLKLGHGKRFADPVPSCAKAIRETDELLSDALKYTRTLVAELSPPVIRDHGLPAALTWLADYMKKHDLSVDVRILSGEQVQVAEDQAVLLFQCVRELLINSSKHAGTGQASISMTHDQGLLRIEVRDEGKGFDPALAMSGEESASGGISSKFGLFSIGERMRAMGGAFDVDSAPGRGMSATLTLPVASRAARAGPGQPVTEYKRPEPPPQAAAEPEGHAHRIRIIVVDDHGMVRQGLRALMENYPEVAVVGEACNGEEAITAVGRLRPHVVVMDINMPKIDGIEATRRIKQSYPETTVIGLSVNADANSKADLLTAGGSLLLNKEAVVEELYAAIRERAVRRPQP